MLKKTLAAIGFWFAFAMPVAHAEFANDFNCTLNREHTVEQLYAFQNRWMAAVRKQGVDENAYKTKIYFPIYGDAIETSPMVFLWRGQFSSGAIWGKVNDWAATSGWGEKFAEVMNCQKGTLWIAPQ